MWQAFTSVVGFQRAERRDSCVAKFWWETGTLPITFENELYKCNAATEFLHRRFTLIEGDSLPTIIHMVWGDPVSHSQGAPGL